MRDARSTRRRRSPGSAELIALRIDDRTSWAVSPMTSSATPRSTRSWLVSRRCSATCGASSASRSRMRRLPRARSPRRPRGAGRAAGRRRPARAHRRCRPRRRTRHARAAKAANAAKVRRSRGRCRRSRPRGRVGSGRVDQRDHRETEPVGQGDARWARRSPPASAGPSRRGGRWRRRRPVSVDRGQSGPQRRVDAPPSSVHDEQSAAARSAAGRSAGRRRGSTSPQAPGGRRRRAGLAGREPDGKRLAPQAERRPRPTRRAHSVERPRRPGRARARCPRCGSGPTDSPVVSATTRGPAKPIMAPASATWRSQSEP